MTTERGQVDATSEMDKVLDQLGVGVEPAKEQAKPEEKQEESVEEQAEAEVTETEEPEAETEEAEVQTEEPKFSQEEVQEQKESFLKEEYGKWQSSILQPITKERDDLRKQVTQLNGNILLKANDEIFAQETDSHGEDAAVKAKTARDAFIKERDRLVEYSKYEKAFKGLLEDGYPSDFVEHLDEHISELKSESRDNLCFELALKYFPPPKDETTKTRDNFIKWLKEQGEWNKDKLETLAQTKAESMKARTPQTHKPTKTRQSQTAKTGFTRQSARDYDPTGKSVEQMMKDAEDLITQFTTRR